MVWFLWLIIYMPHHKNIEIKYGNYKSQAACEKTLKTLKIRATKDIITGFIGSCTNNIEFNNFKKRR